ncbi:MAG: HIT domain-containing protein [Lachnospiraceae bacterium]|jgi:histidine triad (HIT) family protein|nr:HIT domain-containing protein [Lachnospiraceae bacterium]
MKDDCIFCKLANGVIETNTLYEDDDFRVIFDAFPVTKGHVLILAKEHYANIYELPEELASKVFVLAKKIATFIKEVTGCEGVNVLQNNGVAADQTIFHFHVHIIPRYDEKLFNLNQGELDQKVVDEIIAKAKEAL